MGLAGARPNKEQNKVPKVCHEITNHLPKNRRCPALKQKVKGNSNARESDEKSFLKENMMLVNQLSESANTKEVKKKGIEREQCL